jgi:hypothetical protein
MGRTFGLLIVSIGLWLVVSLPTREPTPLLSTDQAAQPAVSSTVAATNLTSMPPVAAASSGNGGSANGTSVDNGAFAMRPAAIVAAQADADKNAGHPIVARLKKSQDERAMAARSREIESEPEAANARPPEPMPMITPTTGSPGTQVAIAMVPPRTFVPVPVPVPASARDVVAGTASSVASVPVAPNVKTPGAPKAAASGPVAPPGTAATGTAAPGTAVSAGIAAPRIFESVRRDLAVMAARPAQAVSKTETAALAQAAKSGLAAAQAATDGEPALTKPRQAAGPALRPARPRDDDDASAERVAVTRKAQPRIAAARQEPKPAAGVQKQQRVRVTQNYAPPSYVGRVVVRYTPPPAVFVPSSSPARRSQFRGENMWEAIRRSGM